MTTLAVAGLSTSFAMVIGTALALVIHRTDFRWPSTMTGMLALSFYFPSFILAMAWIVIGSPGGVINDILRNSCNIESVSVDIYSTWGIIFVMVLHQVPFVYLTIRGPIMGMDPSLRGSRPHGRRVAMAHAAPRHAADAGLCAGFQLVAVPGR